MTKNYSIWTDVDSNKEIKKIIKTIKNNLSSHISIINLIENDYQINLDQSIQRLRDISTSLDPYFPRENENICDDVWIDYKVYYLEDETLYEEEISDHELLKKKLNILKKKINFISANLPKVKTLKGKDMNGEPIEEDVLVEAYTDISIQGQLPIVESYFQFKKLLETII